MKIQIFPCIKKGSSHLFFCAKLVVMVALFAVSSLHVYANTQGTNETNESDTQQQQGANKVTGQVLDSKGVSVIGASVVIKGTAHGTVTDVDGKFSLEAPQDAILRISYIGYVGQNIAVSGRSKISVVLKEDQSQIDEVVVVGYSTQVMKHVTGSIASMKGKDLGTMPAGNLASSLQGLLPGLSVTGGEARPGVAASMSIRNAGASPIYVIDGFVIPENTLVGGASGETMFNNLDPNDIESISVLKDGAAAVYGARGANGVILVTTKHGENGKMRISYNAQFGASDAVGSPKMMSAYQYGQFYNRYMGESGQNIPASQTNLQTYFQPDELETMKGVDYNWLDQAWHSSSMMKHNINLSGGTKTANFFASVGYYTDNGNLSTVNYNRWTYRAGADMQLASHLKIGLQVSGNYAKRNTTFNKVNSESDDDDYQSLLTTPRYMPSYVDGLPLVRFGTADKATGSKLENYNYFAIQDLNNKKQNFDNTTQINATTQYDFDWLKPLKGLSAKVAFSKVIYNNENNQLGSYYDAYSFKNRTGSGNHLYEGVTAENGSPTLVRVKNGNRVWRGFKRSESYQLNFNLNYNRDFGKNSIGALFSAERSENDAQTADAWQEDPIEASNGEFNTATGAISARTSRSQGGTLSYIGRLNYAYADKYLFEALVRSDASTKFAPVNYWGTFPSFSAGWVASEENFFKNNIKFVDFFKVRASLGFLGTDNTAPWQWRQRYTYQVNHGAVFGPNGDLDWSLKMEAAPNYNAHWDKSTNMNLGFDMRFLRTRLSVTNDWYYIKQTDMLQKRNGSLPVTVGAIPAQENYGAQSRYGTEISIGWHDKIGRDVNYFVTLNTGFHGGKILKQDWATIIPINGVHPNDPIDNGKWGYNCLGMFRSQQDIDDYVQKYHITSVFGVSSANLKPGMLYYKDQRGKQQADGSYAAPDGIIDANDVVKLAKKNSNPYGFSLRFGGDWKGFSISAQLNASWGGYNEIPQTARFVSTGKRKPDDIQFTNLPSFMSDMFDINNNVNATYPNMAQNNAIINNAISDFWMVSSTRISLRTITLGYSLPKKITKKMNIESCKFTLNAINLLSLYNPYPDNFMDPMSVYGVYPTLRTVSLGLNMSF